MKPSFSCERILKLAAELLEECAGNHVIAQGMIGIQKARQLAGIGHSAIPQSKGIDCACVIQEGVRNDRH